MENRLNSLVNQDEVREKLIAFMRTHPQSMNSLSRKMGISIGSLEKILKTNNRLYWHTLSKMDSYINAQMEISPAKIAENILKGINR